MLATYFRPKKFEEVKGQDLPKEVLKAIVANPKKSPRSLVLAGSWGSGKCVVGDTPIKMGVGLRRMEDLFGGVFRIEGSTEGQGLQVLVRGNREEVTHKYYGGFKEVLKVVLSNGATLEGTYVHPVLVWNGEKFETEWKQLQELSVGDWLLTDLSGVKIEEGPEPARGSYDGSGFRKPLEINKDVAYFLGLMAGDGSYNRYFCFMTSDRELEDWFYDFCLNALNTKMNKIYDSRREYLVSIKPSENTRELREWMQSLGVWGRTSGDKGVPECIWEASWECQKAFLQGLMDTDGGE